MGKGDKIIITLSDLRPVPQGAQAPPVKAMTAGSVLMLAAVAIALGGLIFAATRLAAMEHAASAKQPGAAGGPAAVCLVLDRSGSMADAPLRDAKAAAKDFVLSLKPDDEIVVVDFGSDVHVTLLLRQVEPTAGAGLPAAGPGRDDIYQAIDAINSEGMTALWDAGLEGVNQLSRAAAGRQRTLVLLTDGMNNASRNDADDLIAAARSGHVVVHTVALGHQTDRAVLARVAQATSGSTQFAATSSQLRGIYRDLGRRIRR